MIRDGVDLNGWQPIDTASIAEGWWESGTLCVDPVVIEGMTTCGVVVEAFYWADGDYEDRWCDITGQIEYKLAYWRPLS